MFFSRVVVLGLAGAVLGAPLAAQGIPRRASIGGGKVVTQTRMMVANPYPTASADSATAVAIGQGLRQRMEKIAGSDYAVLADSTMNRALVQFGYPANSLLSPLLARQLAQSLNGRIVVVGTLAKGEGGARTVDARLMGTNDDAGVARTVVMQPSEKPGDFGRRIADTLAPALKAYDDAKACVDNRKSDPKKAQSSAEKALKEAPDDGLAEYCLALLAQDRNAPQQEVLQHLQNTVKGDPQSLVAWSQIAQIRDKQADTAGVVNAYTQILTVAPGDPQIRERIFRYFLNIGRPNLARETAERGLALDPYNADLYDLRSNACLFQGDFRCAVQSLEQAYQVDSARADTLFFTKLTVAAEQRLADTMPVPTAQDTATFVRWAQAGVRKYPNNVTLLQTLNRAYAASGQVDSSLAVTQRLMQVDSTATTPALAAVQALANAKRLTEAQPYITFVTQRGDAEAKEKLAGVLLQSASQMIQPPTPDYAQAASAAKLSVQLAAPNGRVAPPANYVLGVAAFQAAANMDAGVEKAKSCDGAKQEQSFLNDAATGFAAGKSFKPDVVAKFEQPLAQFQKRAAALVKAFCR